MVVKTSQMEGGVTKRSGPSESSNPKVGVVGEDTPKVGPIIIVGEGLGVSRSECTWVHIEGQVQPSETRPGDTEMEGVIPRREDRPSSTRRETRDTSCLQEVGMEVDTPQAT